MKNTPRSVEIYLDGTGRREGNKIVLDGTDITRHIRHITIEHGADYATPTVTLKLANPEVIGELPEAIVRLVSDPIDGEPARTIRENLENYDR